MNDAIRRDLYEPKIGVTTSTAERTVLSYQVSTDADGKLVMFSLRSVGSEKTFTLDFSPEGFLEFVAALTKVAAESKLL